MRRMLFLGFWALIAIALAPRGAEAGIPIPCTGEHLVLVRKLPEDVKTEVQADVDELKKLLEADDTDKDAFTAAITKLGESSQKMGAAMYAANESEAQADGGAGGATTEGAAQSEDEVVDAEIVDEPGSEDEQK